MSEPHEPIPQEMIDAITKTFVISHADDPDDRLARALVYNAGRLAWRMREAGLTTEYKTSVSDVVTAADRAAEGFVAGALRALRPDDGLLGEEGAASPSASGRVWVIDPVDGTYNFTTGSDYWCSALALVDGDPDEVADDRGGRLLLGAVHRPAMGYTWFGGPDHPTTRDDRRLTVPDVAAGDTCLGGYLRPADMTVPAVRDPWVACVEQFATWRMLGAASVDLGDVADGHTGCWLQASVKSWDWLPGKALVEGAGGVCRRVTAAGRQWSVAGAPTAVEAVVDTLTRHS
ncbi:inositol monophosphatase family protein [Corynebacterium bovis]|uniref:inositol monophosphatase family protein n=1 Tax=Corynebacterium bovis TaxID=36808 RepID=UPI00244B634A|nr:inositol monophosphatase family protein [Corynebacterium bovis]MDH2456217.1 inositol monophosphatase family protein [Corynebacterium bovis]